MERDIMRVIIAYETRPVAPMTAPVIRFSLMTPNAPATIMIKDVMEIDTKIARSIPTIMCLKNHLLGNLVI